MGVVWGRGRRSQATAERRCLVPLGGGQNDTRLAIHGRGKGVEVVAQAGDLFWEFSEDGVRNDASVDHVILEVLTIIERLFVEALPIRGANVEEDGMELVGVGRVKNANDSPTKVLELVACERSPVVWLFDRVGLVVLNVSGPRVLKNTVSSAHPALTRE